MTVLAGGAAFAASTSETAIYVSGTTGVSARTMGTLQLSDEKTMHFRTGSNDVAVPYEAITKAELGKPTTHESDGPLYKKVLWSMPKRLASPGREALTVEFKNEAGSLQTMQLEMTEGNAMAALSTIESRRTRPVAAAAAPKADDWWGDSYWKTTRNADKWPATTASK